MSLADIFAMDVIRRIFINGLIVGLFICVCAALLGVSLVLKRYSMIGDGLSHVGFGTMAVAAAVGTLTGATGSNLSSVTTRDYSLAISIPVVILTAFFLLRLSENSNIKGDAAIALLSTGAIAIGVIVYNVSTGMTADVCSSMFGSANLLTSGVSDVVLSVVLCIAVLVLFVLFYHKIFAVTFDENFGNATGIRVGRYKMLISLLTALTIVLGMRMMGAILISGLIIFPALTSMRLCKTFRGVIICSVVVSVICFLTGYITACVTEMQTGPCVVIVNIIAFLAFSLIAFVKGRVIRK